MPHPPARRAALAAAPTDLPLVEVPAAARAAGPAAPTPAERAPAIATTGDGDPAALGAVCLR
jgi:hypothetical protein